jgi:glutamine amidotransferase-like uncharacterized protein
MNRRVLPRLPLLAFVCLALSGCGHAPPTSEAPILLFNGTGTSANDVAAVETILREHELEFESADTPQLNAMTAAQLQKYRLLIVPGGNYIQIGDHLTADASANVRKSVAGGLNYLGICAGALLAGEGPNHHLNLTSGVRFDFYAEVQRGVHKTVAPISTVDGPTLEQYWEDGPQLAGWGDIVAKYPDGTPAVAQGRVGQGWVLLCGVHPEAPENWRTGMNFTTPASESQAYAAKLIKAALDGTELPHE